MARSKPSAIVASRSKQRKRSSRESKLRRFVLPVIVAALLAAHFVLALFSVRHKSNTYDELAHLTRGYSYTLTNDFRLGPPHPPLAHYWAAIPGRAMSVKAPKRDQAAWHTSDVWVIGRQFFYYKNLGNAAIIDRLLFRGRAMIALFSVACGGLVFLWSRRLFGNVGGVISLTLFALSPTMLAHARLVTTDCAVTLFFLAGLTAIWWVLHTISVASVLAGAAALACLFLSKMSAPLIIPVGLALMILRTVDRRPLLLKWFARRIEIRSRVKRVGVWFAVMILWIVCVWVCIWGAYGFRYKAMTGPDTAKARFYSPNGVPEGKTVWEWQLRKLDRLAPVISFLREHRLLPEAYVYNAAFAAQTARGRNAFLNGKVNILGFRWFFPYTFLVKTPLPLFVLLIVAAAGLCRRRRPATKTGNDSRPDGGEDRQAGSIGWRGVLWHGAPLWIFFALYWVVSIRSHLNIGHRHILPTYPILFVFCGAAAGWIRSSKAPLRWITPVLVGLFAATSLWTFPNFLTYFNWIAGGPDRAYRHLVDSSLDWGQDLPEFKRWLDRRRTATGGDEVQPVYFAYFGSGRNLAVSHYGIKCQTLPKHLSAKDARGELNYQPGIYAISATTLQQVYFEFRDPQSGRRQIGLTWTPEMESEYQRLRTRFKPLIESPNTPQAREPYANRKTVRAFNRFETLRFARFCAYLRPREPDDNVNHTILIYELDADTVRDALDGPPPSAD